MAVRSRDELMQSARSLIGDRSDDEVMAFLEDMTDTYGDLEGRVGEDWKSKYEENDASWRQKYKERFFGESDPAPSTGVGSETQVENMSEENDLYDDGPDTYEELFKEE